MNINIKAQYQNQWRIPLIVAVCWHVIIAMLPIGTGSSRGKEGGGVLSISLKSLPLTQSATAISSLQSRQKTQETTNSTSESRQLQPNHQAGENAISFDLTSYGQRLQRAITRHKQYPRLAKRQKAEGTVVIKMTLMRNGNLKGSPIIKNSSASQLLDEEAIRMVYASAPFPPLPGEFKKENLTLLIPIQFSMN